MNVAFGPLRVLPLVALLAALPAGNAASSDGAHAPASASSVAASARTAASAATATSVERGRYLVRAGDCESCHTAPGGKELAGGYPIPTPFGVIYSTNLTPDRDTGIGAWSKDDFWNALHRGKDDEGEHLYPAMPYPWFTKMSRADVDAIKDYLATVPAADVRNKEPELPWPLSWRTVMAGWNLLFFHEGEMQPDPAKSAEWNRGAYLVEGPGHCGACHTPKNALGAVKRDEAFRGGSVGEHWFAPSLTSDVRDGIGDWSVAEIVEYLKTGSNDKTASAGEMTNVVRNSTQYLSDSDLKAIAVYLKDIPATREEANAAAASAETIRRGEAVYVDNCTGCHMDNGAGLAKVFPPLAKSASIQASDPGSLLHVVLGGAVMAAPKTKPTGLAMPGFRDKLNDQQIAEVVSYIRNAWGNHGSPVDAATVAKVRKAEIESPQGDPGAKRAEMLVCRSRGAPATCPAPAAERAPAPGHS